MFNFCYVYLFVFMWVCGGFSCHNVYLEIRGQLAEVRSLIPPNDQPEVLSLDSKYLY